MGPKHLGGTLRIGYEQPFHVTAPLPTDTHPVWRAWLRLCPPPGTPNPSYSSPNPPNWLKLPQPRTTPPSGHGLLISPSQLCGHSQVGRGHGFGISRLGHLASLLQQGLQEELKRPG